jgi:hypothetical protein
MLTGGVLATLRGLTEAQKPQSFPVSGGRVHTPRNSLAKRKASEDIGAKDASQAHHGQLVVEVM